VNRRLGTLLVTGLLALFAGCGSGGGSTAGSTSLPRPGHRAPARPTGVAAVCGSIPIQRVRSLISAAGGRESPLRRDSSSTSGRSVCSFHGRTANIEAQLDVATRAVTRYFNRVTESQQFSSTNRLLRPVPVHGLGDRGVPGGGANWIPFFDQLLSARGQGALLVNFFARGAANDALKRSAIRFSELVYSKVGVRRGRYHSEDRRF
jgi:hypothetical protein